MKKVEHCSSELQELGEALHGAHWIGPTARDLGVRHDTLRHWVSGRRSAPAEILSRLRVLVESHRRAVARVQKGK